MTFYHLKAIKGSTKYLGITTGPVKYVSSGSRYKTKFTKGMVSGDKENFN